MNPSPLTYILPHPILAPYIECYWVLNDTSGQRVPIQRMPADGRIEIMFSFASGSRRTNADGLNVCEVYANSFVLGVREQGYLLEHFSTPYYVAIRFKAGGLAAFAQMPMADVTGLYAELDCIWDKKTVRQLENQLYDAKSPYQQAQILEQALFAKLNPPSHLTSLLSAMHLLEKNHQNITIPNLAQELMMSQKHLERLFTRYVGLRPSLFARVIRFQQVMYHAINSTKQASWLQLAINNGYYDQSHFNRDFKQFVGLPPNDFLAVSHDFIQISTPTQMVELLQDMPQ